MMQPGDLVTAAACLMFGGGLVAYLFGAFFCTRPAPRWLHWWRDVALALLGARILAARVFDVPLDWHSASIYANIALSQAAIAAYRWRHVIGPHGDRCSG